MSAVETQLAATLRLRLRLPSARTEKHIHEYIDQQEHAPSGPGHYRQ